MTIVIRINKYQNDTFVIQKYSLNDTDTPLLWSVTTGNMNILNEVIERIPDSEKTFEMLEELERINLSSSNEAVISYNV